MVRGPKVKTWETKKLGDIAYLAGRIGWKGLTAKEYKTEGPLFVSVHSLNYGDSVDFRDAFHISQARYDESPEIMLRKNDILICKDGAGIGKLGIIRVLPSPATINSSLLLIRAGKEIAPSFLYRSLCSPNFQKIVQERIDGATTPHLYQREIREFTVPVPPLPEQRRIVAILDEAFAGLEAVRANAQKNLKNARGVFDSQLTSTFTQERTGWSEQTLQDISKDFGRGKSKHRPRNDSKLYGGKYPFIQTGDVRNCDHIIIESTQTYNEIGLAQSKLWPKGTICVTIAANIAETGILGFDACFPDSVIGIVVDNAKTSNEYVEFLLQSVKAQLKAQGKGSAQDNINLATFENRRFPFPSLVEQRRIVGTLNELSEEIRNLESLYTRKLAAIAELKQSLLQKAFTGQLTSRQSLAA